MNSSQIIADRVREVFHSGRWIANTNYKEQLINTSREEAIKKIGTLNSIAALTFHVNYYLAGLIQVFDGGKLNISDKYSFDLPPINSDQDWRHLVDELLGNAERFAAKVERVEDAGLDKPFVDEKYGSYLRNIEGVIEHSYYHLGQISIIRKLIAESTSDCPQ